MLYLANMWKEQFGEEGLDALEREYGGLAGNWLSGKWHQSEIPRHATHILYAPCTLDTSRIIESDVPWRGSAKCAVWILYPDQLLGWDESRSTFAGQDPSNVLPQYSVKLGYNSNYTKRLFEMATPALGKGFVLHPGIQVETISELSSKVGVGIDRPLRVTWHHQWRQQKGPLIMMEAIEELSKRFPDVQFEIGRVGEEGVQYSSCQSSNERFEQAVDAFLTGRSSNVRLREREVAQEDYWVRLAESDVVFSTAVEESFGVAMLEAAATGAVCVVPDRLVYDEVLPNAQTYLNGSVAALVQTIGDVLAQSRPDFLAMSLACQQDAQRFSARKFRTVLRREVWLE